MCRLLRSSAPPLLVAIDASIEHAGYMTDTVTVEVEGSGTCASVHRGEMRCIGTHDDYNYDFKFTDLANLENVRIGSCNFFTVQ